jgi:PKD repeat protein
MHYFLKSSTQWLFAVLLLALSGCSPSADFTVDVDEGDAPLTVKFTDQSAIIALGFIDMSALASIRSWEWDYGDGETGVVQNPIHTYQNEGSYTVTLKSSGHFYADTVVMNDLITVGPNPGIPVAAFQMSVNEGTAPLTVEFTDTSIIGANEPIIAWRWDFGDGSISTQQNPSHTYETIGVYTVTLTVESSIGTDTRVETDVIRVRPAGPIADFTISAAVGEVPLMVQFADTTVPGSAAITDWLWNFGDGGTSPNPSPSHTYDQPGIYTVSLTVTSSVASDTETKVDYVMVNALQGPTASFTSNPLSGDVALEVAFQDASTPGSQPITDWLWDFGDVATSTVQNPTHVYSTAGTYSVSLTVNTQVGADTETKTDLITVNALRGPTAAFSANPVEGDVPLTVRFTDECDPGSGTIWRWEWNFGDGGGSTMASPTHRYDTVGIYMVSLKVTTAVGDHTVTKPALIHVKAQGPTADFEADRFGGTVPLVVQFTDTSDSGTEAITDWYWDFGDGFDSTVQNPAHTYSLPGEYVVSLTVTTGVGANSFALSPAINVVPAP